MQLWWIVITQIITMFEMLLYTSMQGTESQWMHQLAHRLCVTLLLGTMCCVSQMRSEGFTGVIPIYTTVTAEWMQTRISTKALPIHCRCKKLKFSNIITTIKINDLVTGDHNDTIVRIQIVQTVTLLLKGVLRWLSRLFINQKLGDLCKTEFL